MSRALGTTFNNLLCLHMPGGKLQERAEANLILLRRLRKDGWDKLVLEPTQHPDYKKVIGALAPEEKSQLFEGGYRKIWSIPDEI